MSFSRRFSTTTKASSAGDLSTHPHQPNGLARIPHASVDLGRSHTEVAQIVGVARETVSRGMRRRALAGERALDAQRRGRRPGHTKLCEAQQRKVAGLIVGKNPDQLKLPGFLWTRALVAELIARECGVDVGIDTVGRYLRAWGMSPQKPMRRADEHSDEAVPAGWMGPIRRSSSRPARRARRSCGRTSRGCAVITPPADRGRPWGRRR